MPEEQADLSPELPPAETEEGLDSQDEGAPNPDEPETDSTTVQAECHEGEPPSPVVLQSTCILGLVTVDAEQALGAVLGTIDPEDGPPVRFRQVVGPAGGPTSVNAVNGREAVLCGRLIRQGGMTFLDVTRVISASPPPPPPPPPAPILDLLPLLLALMVLLLPPLALLAPALPRRRGLLNR